ncbi:reverse transcriptase domain-containing protein [Artemisia annua]|uniref:Reverse transcriptase domain-containing protein n=1 Tax=Artemisia annua TaxID=35608 RepID=A0A2U1NJJ6_ARTAN|nr:reverse transcriptase domain-containing protein [Artemisia annua]
MEEVVGELGKSLQQSSILKSLATWGKDDGITMLVNSMLDGSGLESFGQGGGDFLEERTTGNTNIRQCLRKVADGHFTAAVKVLSSSGVAPYSDIDGCPLVALNRSLKISLKASPQVVNLWLAGRCPTILAEFVAMKGVGKEMSKYLSDFQFGVGVSGGAEAVLHSVNRVLSEYHNDGSFAMLTVDFSNAFNLNCDS